MGVPVSPDITVIIVNYNGGEALADCVSEALKAKAVAAVVVVDNASTDMSLDRVAARWGATGKVAIIRNPRNLGFSTANNVGLRRTQSSFVLLLNPDCIPEPGSIDSLVEFMSSDIGVGVVGGLVLNSDRTEQKGCRRDLPDPVSALGELPILKRWIRGFNKTGEPLPSAPAMVPAVSGAFMLVRRAALDAVDGLDEGYFLHFEDLELCSQIAAAGWGVWFHPLAVAVHAKGVSSSSRPLLVHWHKHRSMWRFFHHRIPVRRVFGRLIAFLLVSARFFALLPAVLWRSAKLWIK